MVQGDEAALELVVTQQQLSKPVEPAMTHLRNPARCLLSGVAPLGFGFLAPTVDMRNVAMPLDDAQQRNISVASVGTEVLALPLV